MKTYKIVSDVLRVAKKLCLFVFIFTAAGVEAQTTWMYLDVNSSIGQAKNGLYGMNLNLAMRPDRVTNQAYQDGIAYMNSKFVRYHSAEQIIDGASRSWINASSQSWDTNVINTCLSNLSYTVEAKMVTIAQWPDWMDTDNDGRLDSDKFNAYADFCADLVDIVNNQQGHGVTYWEPFNEVEGEYPNDVQTLANIFNLCAQKMKANDSSIKMVGGAWTQPWAPTFPGTLGDFLAGVKGNVDVCSYHQYGTGDGQLSPSDLYDKADNFAGGVNAVQDRLNQNGMGTIPIWLGEHNIFWSWQSDSQFRMTGITGGVFDALLLTKMLRQGKLDAAFSWIDADTRYGKISYSYSSWTYDDINPGAHVYSLFNNYGVGQLVESYPDSGDIQALGIKDTSRNLITYVVINRSDNSQPIYLGNSSDYNWVSYRQVTDSGLATGAISSLQWQSVPAHSVTFYLGGLGSAPPVLGGDFRLEAESFDRGASSYAVSGNRVLINYNSPNSWGEYDGFDFVQGGYDLTLYYASHWGGMDVAVKLGTQTLATFSNLKQTWNVDSYREERITNVSIPAATNETLRIEVENGQVKLDYLDFQKR
ncbi:MAG: hypothetical protein AAF558_16010 [Verrucomicrobiota bacterium]